MINIIPIIVFGQTKKERIETLTFKLDSLNMVVEAQMNEINLKDSMILDLNGQIRTSNSTLDKKTLEINILKESNYKKDQDIQKIKTDNQSKGTMILDLDSQVKVLNTALEKRNIEVNTLQESNSKKNQEIQKKNEVIINLEREVSSLRDVIQELEKAPKNSVYFDQFKISKGQLGNIKVGMRIREAEQQFSGLIKKEDYETDLGVGGGGVQYLYYSDNELMFALIPELDTDKIIFIIAAHKKMQTTNGLNPKSTVSELIQKYPNMKVAQDNVGGGEYYRDERNGWEFVFRTNENTLIGEYPEFDSFSKPIRLTAKSDWILIR